MEPKLIKTWNAEYVKTNWNGKNESGVTPIGDRVLVLADKAADRTSGAVFLPEQLTERQSMAAESGVLVEAGDDAWTWNSDRTRPFGGRRPMVGDRVIFQKYAGQLVLGDDGELYRLMDDNSIAAIDG